MRPAFHDLALVEHDDAIGLLDRRQPVRDNERGSSFEESIETKFVTTTDAEGLCELTVPLADQTQVVVRKEGFESLFHELDVAALENTDGSRVTLVLLSLGGREETLSGRVVDRFFLGFFFRQFFDFDDGRIGERFGKHRRPDQGGAEDPSPNCRAASHICKSTRIAVSVKGLQCACS